MTFNPACEVLRDDILDLLYEDGDAAARTRARAHLAACVPCRIEYGELKGVRKSLGGWTLPAPVAPRPVETPRAWRRQWPAGLAAAAGLILGVGLAVSGRTYFDNLKTQPGASGPSSVASTTAANGAGFVSREELVRVLNDQESRYQAQIAELRQTLTQAADTRIPASIARPASNSTEAASFERLLRASEERQARLIEARLAGFRSESDLQRQYDLAQIAAGFAYIDSRTGADAARTSELMKNLVRVTAKPQDR